MSHSPNAQSCPCGLAHSYDACCGRYIDHPETAAPSAEALMRSRYSAYARKHSAYVLSSWHPESRPEQLDLLAEDSRIKWLTLEVLRVTAGQEGDQEGVVEFIARYKLGGRAQRLHEISRFVALAGRWYYLDGDLID
jgi:SEC-C motif-containing protein